MNGNDVEPYPFGRGLIHLRYNTALTFTVRNGSLPQSVNLTNQGLVSTREVVSGNTPIRTDRATPDVIAIVSADGRRNKATEWRFQSRTIYLCRENIIDINYYNAKF